MISYPKDTKKNDSNNLYLVYTPFQLFNVLNIISNSFKDASNTIVLMHQNMTKYLNLISDVEPKINILNYEFAFEKTVKGNRWLIYFKLFIDLINIRNQIKLENNNNSSYDNLFVPSKAIGCNVVYAHFKKVNPRLVLNVYDDGVGTYDRTYFEFKKFSLYRIISKILLKYFIWDNIANLYCYSPEVLDLIDNNIAIKKIITSEKVKLIFSADASEVYKKYLYKKVIFFEQGSMHGIRNGILDFFDLYKKYYTMEELIVKKHPRLDLSIENSDISIDDSGKMFESILFNIDCSDSLLVSVTSTACITPFMILNEMPYVIFLGNIGTNRNSNVLDAKYMKNIVNSYKSERFFTPKSLSELEAILIFLDKKLGSISEQKIDYVRSEK